MAVRWVPESRTATRAAVYEARCPPRARAAPRLSRPRLAPNVHLPAVAGRETSTTMSRRDEAYSLLTWRNEHEQIERRVLLNPGADAPS